MHEHQPSPNPNPMIACAQLAEWRAVRTAESTTKSAGPQRPSLRRARLRPLQHWTLNVLDWACSARL